MSFFSEIAAILRHKPEPETESEKPRILTEEEAERVKSEAYSRNIKNGKYKCHIFAPGGSVDNPIVVGLPEYSNILVYNYKTGKWLLTDAFGNGWVR